jgi:hypothetical protein
LANAAVFLDRVLVGDTLEEEEPTEDALSRRGDPSVASGVGGVGLRRNCLRIAWEAPCSASRRMNPWKTCQHPENDEDAHLPVEGSRSGRHGSDLSRCLRACKGPGTGSRKRPME